jgi:hypothetical protein
MDQKSEYLVQTVVPFHENTQYPEPPAYEEGMGVTSTGNVSRH